MTLGVLIGFVTAALAILTFWKTRRIGPVAVIIVGGALVFVANDPSVLQSIGSSLGSLFTAFFTALPGWLGI